MNARNLMIFMALGMALAASAQDDLWSRLARYEYGASPNAAQEAFDHVRSSPPGEHAAIEQRLMALLGLPEATEAARQTACRLLVQVGSEQAVAALAPLLVHERLSDYARLPLERIGGEQAAAALRAALGQAPDAAKPGLLGSLAALRDARAVSAIEPLLKHDDPAIASSAVRALGAIGGPDAAGILTRLAGEPEPAPAVLRALVAAADALDARNASEAYRLVLSRQEPSSAPAALSGWLRADAEKGAEAALAALQASDSAWRPAALAIIAEGWGGLPATRRLVQGLSQFDVEGQAQLIVALGYRRDAAAEEAVMGMLASEDPALGSAACQAAAVLATPAMADALLARGDDAAESALTRLAAGDLDDKLIGLLSVPESRDRALRLLVARGHIAAVPAIVALLDDPSADVQRRAWQTLGVLAQAEHMPMLAEKAVSQADGTLKNAAFGTLRAISLRVTDKVKAFDVVAAHYDQGSESVQSFILELAAVAASPASLELVKGVFASGEPALRERAFRALESWRTAHAAPFLLEQAQSASEASERLRALRAFLQTVSKDGLDQTERAKLLLGAEPMVERDEEVNLLLGAVKVVHDPLVVPLATRYLGVERFRKEAEAAAMSLLQGLRRRPTPELVALAEALLTSEDARVLKQAQEILAQIRR